MKPFMGIYASAEETDSLLGNDPYLKLKFESRNIYPEKPMLSEDQLASITSFYLDNSPDTIFTKLQSPKITNDLSLFEVKEPEFKVKIPSTTMAKFNEGRIFIGEANTASLSVFDKNLDLKQTANIDQGAVNLNFFDNVTFVTVMGSFSPTDLPLGKITAINNQNGRFQTLIDSLQRPVHSSIDDLNGDGLPDIIVCEYGNLTGQLSLFENQGNNRFKKKILQAQPGAIKSFITDMDSDGDKDIVALFAQGNEGIWQFENDGKGGFKSQALIQFPSIYGSAYINFFDFDNDGKNEIIYCNGDNADASITLKPYHGIRIFKEIEGEWKEDFFFQLNGAYKALPNDFDGDGDIDLAAISFFPDLENNPNESFVFLENDGSMNFTARTFEDPARGPWLTMDAADIDSDGDIDLVLGPLTMQPEPAGNWIQKWMSGGLPFLYLENVLK